MSKSFKHYLDWMFCQLEQGTITEDKLSLALDAYVQTVSVYING